jgi:hypothetical protein
VTEPALLQQAARGDVDAQAQMVQATLALIAEGKTTFPEGVRAAEWWARLAAVHGRHNDRMILAGVLMYAAQVSIDQEEEEMSLLYQAEALLVLNDLADDGDEKAALFAQCVADELPAEASELALYVERMARAATEEGVH